MKSLAQLIKRMTIFFKRVCVACLLILGAVGSLALAQAPSKLPPWKYDDTQKVKLPSGLEYVIIQPGAGPQPQIGDRVTLMYHGTLESGKVFDSTYERNKPFSFSLGTGQVIRGYEEGVAQLKEGTRALLIIPPHLGYGEYPVGDIPPNSTLYFYVELLKVKSGFKPFAFDPQKLQSSASGLKYQIIEEGKGERIKEGMRIWMHYHFSKKNGENISGTFDSERVETIIAGKGQLFPAWEEALSLLREGGKGVYLIPPSLLPASMPNTEELVMCLEIVRATEIKPFQPYPYDKRKLLKTPSGLQYYIVEEGKGKRPIKGEKVSIHYHGAFDNQIVFDSSFETGEPFSFTIGRGNVIKGWEEAVMLLKKGSKAVIIVPPSLGYGKEGLPPTIPPNATLIFHLHLLD